MISLAASNVSDINTMCHLQNVGGRDLLQLLIMLSIFSHSKVLIELFWAAVKSFGAYSLPCSTHILISMVLPVYYWSSKDHAQEFNNFQWSKDIFLLN